MNPTTRSLSLAVRGAANYLRKRPLCVSFEITYNCNARCKHCHLGGSAPEDDRATPEEFGRIARELKPVVAQISGGEPLLRKDVEEVVRALRRPGRAPFIVLTTNGSLLTREKYGRLREAGVDEISLSLDYPDERHDEFRGIPGLFQKIRTLALGLKDVRNSGITLNCVIQRDNFRELPRLAELAREWGLRMNFSSYTLLRTRKKEYMISAEEIGELREVLEKIREFKKRHDTVFTSDYVLRRIPEYFTNGAVEGCRAGERFFVVNPDGTISPCGLIIRKYRSRKEMLRDFLKTNDCALCYTSIRANTEKPARYAIADGLRSIRS
jgi:MoaA/NifB/PqqE/SkfB family radical SAM enzyme